MKRIHVFFGIAALIVACLMQSCKQSGAPGNETARRGEPVLVVADPVYDKESNSFSLSLYADSTAGAEITYYLLYGDSVLMQNKEGLFTGIAPFEEGYNVRAKVVWSDTTIMTPVVHRFGFAVPQEPVEKMTAEELQRLINACDKSLKQGKNEHVAQGVKLVVNNCQMKAPRMIPDVIILIENQVWESVEVTSLDYDEYNLITSVTLKPVGEKVAVDEDDEDLDF